MSFASGPASVQGEEIPAARQSAQLELGDEYTGYERTRGAPASSGVTGPGAAAARVGQQLMFYVPNRVLDFLDIFRFDLGFGPSTGAVVRVTKWGQAGMRYFTPASVRIGLRGRRSPVFMERVNEHGVGPWFKRSPQRPVTPLEVGIGADLLIVGAYGGVSLDEAADFFLGIFLFDSSGDDLG